MGQDQLFKTILKGLLQDFLELFFPEAAARLDFENLRFVDKEVFANVPEGEVRQADIVAQLETRDGEPELVLVHVEVQAEPKGDFPRRMFEYYALLRLQYGLPVFPIALYLHRDPAPRWLSTGRPFSGRTSCCSATTASRWHGFPRRSMLERARWEQHFRP